MYKDILQQIDGIEIFPIIALVIFFVCFTTVVIWTMRLDKKTVNEMAHLPLDSDEPATGVNNHDRQ